MRRGSQVSTRTAPTLGASRPPARCSTTSRYCRTRRAGEEDRADEERDVVRRGPDPVDVARAAAPRRSRPTPIMKRTPIHQPIAPGAHHVDVDRPVEAVVLLALPARIPAHEQTVGPAGRSTHVTNGPAPRRSSSRHGSGSARSSCFVTGAQPAAPGRPVGSSSWDESDPPGVGGSAGGGRPGAYARPVVTATHNAPAAHRPHRVPGHHADRVLLRAAGPAGHLRRPPPAPGRLPRPGSWWS